MAKLRVFNFSRELSADDVDAFSQKMLGDVNQDVEVCVVDTTDGHWPPGLRSDSPSLRGECINLRDRSLVRLWAPNIRYHFLKFPGIQFGGNATAALDVPHAILLVLAHELRHVQQYASDGHPKWASEVPYEDQPHEVDARAFVDARAIEILKFRFGKRLPA